MVTFDKMFVGGYQYLVSSDGTYGSDVMCAHDSAGGVSVFCKFRNTGGKTIKYLTIKDVTPINAVGDSVCCSLSGASAQDLTITGPISPGTITKQYQFANIWYNTTIKGLLVSVVEITYMDGTSEIIDVTWTDKEILEEERFRSDTLPKIISGVLLGLLAVGFCWLLGKMGIIFV